MSEKINNITAEEMGSKTWIRHEPWPIDPKNTPQDWINKGYKLVVIGGGKSSFGRHLSQIIGMDITFGFEMPSYGFGAGSELFLTDEEITKLKERAGRIGPSIPIEPFELKMPKIEFYEPNNTHKVSRSEQKNRERFNKKGKK